MIEDPRELCGAQPDEFVRPCWCRAFIENRPEEPIESGADILALCESLDGLQRQACITAGSVVGPPDPAVRSRSAPSSAGRRRRAACRTKVQNLIASPAEGVALLQECDGFQDETALACRWLSKVMSVLWTAPSSRPCGSAPDAQRRRACEQGAGEIDEPLVTFS